MLVRPAGQDNDPEGDCSHAQEEQREVDWIIHSVLIFHTMIMNESSGERKLKVPAIVLLLILKLLC
jgi:hypothetical protein